MLFKTIFFLYPHNVVQNKLYLNLVDSEYEVYFVHDYRVLKSICENFPSPLIFINPEKGRSLSVWKDSIAELQSHEKYSHARLAIISYNNKLVKQEFFGPADGQSLQYILLQQGFHDGTDDILKLVYQYTRERPRKYIRACCGDGEAVFNVKIEGIYEYGEIIDMSSVGMAVRFSGPVELLRNTYLKDIQLKLKGMLLLLSAVVVGTRLADKGNSVYVLLFDRKTTKLTRSRIRLFINRKLHMEIEKKLYKTITT